MTARTTTAAVLVLAVALLVVGCTGGGGQPIPPPPTTVVSVTSPPDPPDLSGANLNAVSGRTTTTKVALTPGDASLSGQVAGPDGPVAGATVHIERLVGESVGAMDVVTAADGTWRAPPTPGVPTQDPAAPPTLPPTTAAPAGPQGLLGGRYRIRAWRSPDLALTAPTVLFLGGAEQKQLPLQLSRYTGLAVTSSVAPSPPIVGELVNVAVLVTTRSVDAEGIVRALGVPAASVSLLAGGGWQLVRADPETDGSGRALFQLRCRAEGQQPLAVNVEGTQFTLNVAACSLPPPSTTSSTDPGGTEPTTSSTSFAGSTTSTRATSTTVARTTTSTA